MSRVDPRDSHPLGDCGIRFLLAFKKLFVYDEVMVSKLIWTTEKRRVGDLIPFEENPRILTEKQAEDLTKSISKFNLAEIPVINTDNKIIAGHQRIAILKKIGRENEIIDVRVPNRKLNESEFNEYNIRSNKNTGSFDFDILANVFDIEDLTDWGFTDEDLGLEVDENKKTFKQISFRVSLDQEEKIRKAIQISKGLDPFTCDTNGKALVKMAEFFIKKYGEK